MRRIILLVTVALVMAAMMVALPGAALAVPGNAEGGGGHVDVVYEDCGFSGRSCNVTFTGGGGGSDKGGGGGEHTKGDHTRGMIELNGGGGSDGSTVSGKGGGGGGGCTTEVDVRRCGSGEGRYGL